MRLFYLTVHGFLFKTALVLLVFLGHEGMILFTDGRDLLTQVQKRHETLQTQINQLDKDLGILSQEQAGYDHLRTHAVFDPLNRLVLVDTLKRQADHYGFESFTLEIAPDTSTPKDGFKVRLTPVILTFTSKTDLEVWSFLDALQDKISGLVAVDKVLLERGENLSLKAQISLSLLHMKVVT